MGPTAQRLIELSGDLFCVLTKDGFLFALSKEWEALLQRSVPELRSSCFFDHLHEKDSSAFRAGFLAVVEGSDLNQLRSRFRTKSGDTVWLQWRATLEPESGLIYAAATPLPPLDVSQEEFERERQKTIHTSKLASLGEMAAGVAHELNNPLSIIMGYLKMLELEWGEGKLTDQEFLRITQGALSSAERAARIIQNLKNLARDGSQDPMERINLVEVIENTLDLIREKYRRHNIQLDVKYAEQLMVKCRRVELSQVILNLLANAYDAVDGNEGAWIKLEAALTPEKFVAITVSNSGPCISPDVSSRLFTPFFTTKKHGRGLGLGLSIAASIMHRHYGDVYLKPNTEVTTFVAQLPVSTEGAP